MNEEITHLQTKLRYVDIHNHWLRVRREAQKGRIAVDYTPTKQMIAYKGLPRSEFEDFLKQVNLTDISPRITERRTKELG